MLYLGSENSSSLLSAVVGRTFETLFITLPKNAFFFFLSLWWPLKQIRWFHVVKDQDKLEKRYFWVYSYGENNWLFKFKLSSLLRVKIDLYKIYLRLQMNRKTSHSLTVQIKDKIWMLRSDVCTCGCEKC